MLVTVRHPTVPAVSSHPSSNKHQARVQQSSFIRVCGSYKVKVSVCSSSRAHAMQAVGVCPGCQGHRASQYPLPGGCPVARRQWLLRAQQTPLEPPCLLRAQQTGAGEEGAEGWATGVRDWAERTPGDGVLPLSSPHSPPPWSLWQHTVQDICQKAAQEHSPEVAR